MSRVEQRWEHLVRVVLSRETMGADAYGRHATGIAGNVPSSLANNRDIVEILRAADKIQDDFQNLYNLDPNSEGRGVLQFKTGLMSVIKQKLAKKESGIIDRSQDIARLQEFYKLYKLYLFVLYFGILISFYSNILLRLYNAQKQGGTPEQEKGAVKAVQDLYDVVQQGGMPILFYLQKIYPGSDVEGAISSNDATDTRAFELSPKHKESQKLEAADIALWPMQQPGKPGKSRLQPSYQPRTMHMILRALQMFGLQIPMPAPDLAPPSTSQPLHLADTSSLMHQT
ncbi:hypothetical protein ACFX2B_046127 [Malus domestica]